MGDQKSCVLSSDIIECHQRDETNDIISNPVDIDATGNRLSQQEHELLAIGKRCG